MAEQAATQTCSDDAVKKFINDNKDINDLVAACVFKTNNKPQTIKQMCRLALVNKEMQASALEWFEKLEVVDRLKIIQDNYGSIKIVDMNKNASDKALLLKLSDTDKFFTDAYWEAESVAEDSDVTNLSDITNANANAKAKDLANAAKFRAANAAELTLQKKYNYNELYTLTQIKHLLGYLSDIKTDGSKQIEFINMVAFGLQNDDGKIIYFTINPKMTALMSQFNIFKEAAKAAKAAKAANAANAAKEYKVFNKINAKGSHTDNNMYAPLSLYDADTAVLECADIIQAKNNYDITFGEYIDNLLKVPIRKKLDQGI